MKSVVGRLLTGICGGLVMAGFNRLNSLSGWLYAASIAGGFVVAFVGAVLIERRGGQKAASAGGIANRNTAQGHQDIDVAAGATVATDGFSAASDNKAGGDQKIKVKIG